MHETMQQIHQLANERHLLYREASHTSLTASQHQRLQQLNNQLSLRWDQYRREYAAGKRRITPDFAHRRVA